QRLTTMIGTVAAAATGSAAAASRDLSSSSTGNPQLVLNEIEKSTEDRRSYRCLLLANGLRAVAISDPDADKSAATACVRTGALRDPRSLQGLAHFCEHMLFLGTARYPDENSFLRFINEHGGVRNAVTSAEFTRYYFDIAPEHLPEALDRLGQFFTEPLFTESATVREVNAVHSEHAKNIPIDARRLLRLDHHLANPQHDYSKYSTGCLETLLPDASKAAELRQRLLQFHSENYSANLTAVAVLGRESLDQLQQLIVAAFSGVANKQLPMPSWESHPYDGTDCGVEVQMVPLRDIQKLEVVFPMKDYTEQFSSQPAHYASHLLGHESAGSLLACLKRRGWANGLSAGCGGGAAGFDFFRVSADLTEAGLANRAAVLRAVFQCVGQLRRAGPQAWVHRELSDLAALAFRYRDREPSAEATQRLARRLLTYPMPQLLTADCLVTEFAPELIAEVLDQLHPHRCKVFAVSKAFEPHCPPDGCVEPIYGVRHRLQPLPPDLLAACLALYNGDAPADGADSLLSDLRLPDPNPFIPSQFALIAAPPGSPPPRVVLEEAGLRLWHRADAQYCLPKLCLTVVMATPDAWSDAFSAANSQLHCQLMSDALNPVLYDAQLAGLSASLAACAEGISLSIQGFGHRLPALLEAVLDRLSRPEVEQLRFDSVIERYRKSLKNFALEQPLQQCLFHQSVLCCSLVWTHQQRLDAIEGATPAAAAEFARCQLLPAAAGGRPRFLLAFACGNAEVEQVVAAGGGIAQTLRRHAAAADGSQGRPQPPEQQPHRQRDVLLPEAGDARRHHLLRCLAAEHHKSSACVVYFQVEPATTPEGQLRRQALTKLLVQSLKERFFNSLRTQQQLGYLVQLAERPGVAACGLSFCVQSERHPAELESRIDEFVEAAGPLLAAMTPAELRDHAEALRARLLERPKRLSGRSAADWAEIASGAACFDRPDRLAALLLPPGGTSEQSAVEAGPLRHEELLDFYRTWVAKDSLRRRKLAIHVISQKSFGPAVQEDKYEGYPGSVITDVAAFKSGLKLGPLPARF
ncbi:hypothetical protein BOX15_Mlig019571g1, partial [Macrostomum lignano]